MPARPRRNPLGLLSVQVALGTMLVVLVVGLLVMLRIDQLMGNSEEERYSERVEQARLHFADRLGLYHDFLQMGTAWVASQDNVVQAIEADDPGRAGIEIDRSLALLADDPERIHIALYDAQGSALPIADAPDTDERPSMVAGALETGETHSGARVGAGGDDASLAVSVPLFNAGDELLGVLDASLKIDRAFMDTYSQELGVEIAFVVDGTTAASSLPGEFDADAWHTTMPGHDARYVDLVGERYLSTQLEVDDETDSVAGMFYLGVAESRVREGVASVRRDVLRVIGLGALLSVAMAFATAQLTTRPVSDLANAAERVRRNDLDVPVPQSGHGELRSLAEVMEEMRLAIRESRQALISANEELASRVDLSAANLAEVSHELGVMHRVLEQLDGKPPGGMPGIAEALAGLDWTDGALIAMANEQGALSVDAIAGISPGAAAALVDRVTEHMAHQPIVDGWYVPDVAVSGEAAPLAARGIGGFALQPLLTPEGMAGIMLVTTIDALTLSPRRAELLRSIAREVARAHERNELANEVEENRRIAEAVLREMSDGVLVLDHTGTCLICNPAAAYLLDQPRAELIGADIAPHLPWLEHDLATLRDQVREASGALLPIITEHAGRPIAITAGPFVTEHPNESGIILLLRDLSAEIEADRVKRDFVSMVGHELRTPLTLIRTSVDLLHEGDAGPLNDTQTRVVQVLRNNSDRLMSLISDLLDMSALDSGRVQVSPDHIDLGDIVRHALDAARGDAQRKQHTLSMHAPHGIVAWADRARVEQVMANLLSNAIKYTPEGGRIDVQVRGGEEMAEVTVQDNGIGIPPDEQERLFEKFYRTTAGRRTTGGTGLGLAISRSLVELQGGTIRCESDGESGTAFTVTLPTHPSGR